MKLIILIFSLFIPVSSFASIVCWDAEIQPESIEILKVPSDKIVLKDGVLYATICLDFVDKSELIYLVGGGDCGGSSLCGSNFLIINKQILKLGYPIKDIRNKSPWKTLSERTEFNEVFNITKDLASAKHFIKQSKSGEKTILTNNLHGGLKSALDNNMPKNLIYQKDLNKFLNENIDNRHNNLQLRIKNFDLNSARMIQVIEK